MGSNEGLIGRPFDFADFFLFTGAPDRVTVLGTKLAGCMEVLTKFHIEIKG